MEIVLLLLLDIVIHRSHNFIDPLSIAVTMMPKHTKESQKSLLPFVGLHSVEEGQVFNKV